ncbi:3TM-type holin [Azospirillum sp. Sh1]|uniref:3TM-type holin n=1 Tax=Azospirillum sp. Sh1 TaxID=2607285 RepID=UPI00165DEB9E|nr:3TM-type holin [Azospirillum sp. Sh1]
MLPLIPFAISLAAEFLPDLVGKIAGDNAEKVAKDVVSAAKAVTGQSEQDAILTALRADPAAVAKLQEAFIDYEKTVLQEETKRIDSINETIREEVRSEHGYVRNMRPTFGYAMAFTWVIQMLAVTWAIVMTPAEAARIIQAVAELGFMWAVGLSVVGVYVWRRSDEKGAGGSLLDRLPFPMPGKR